MFQSTVVGFKLRGHFELFFIIISDEIIFLDVKGQLNRQLVKLQNFDPILTLSSPKMRERLFHSGNTLLNVSNECIL